MYWLSRSPLAETNWTPSYCQVSSAYWWPFGSKPEKSPSRSSVSWNCSLMIVEAFVYASTYSRKSFSSVSTWLMIPPRKATSVPARIGTNRSARALVRVNRGSTWITVAPRALAASTHWKPTGCASAKLEPSITMQSACCMSCMKVVAPPRPNDVPRPITVELWQIRAWFSTWTTPSAENSFLIR